MSDSENQTEALLAQERDASQFRRQMIATLVGAAVGFVSSGTISVFQSLREARTRKMERQLSALKEFNDAVAEAEALLAAEVQLVEDLDSLVAQAKEAETATDKELAEASAKLETRDTGLNAERYRLSGRWATSRGRLRSAHLALRAHFTGVPDLGLPSLDQSFSAILRPDPAKFATLRERVAERRLTYTTWRDAVLRAKATFTAWLDQQRAMAEGLAVHVV